MGSILVLLGVIFAVLDFFIPDRIDNRLRGGLLTLAVVLIGIGVLLGAEWDGDLNSRP